ncbi:MAG UNVERIFIED_CONTAM: hypothetical protein LVT10_21435 [Anaerolineae bacterium]
MRHFGVSNFTPSQFTLLEAHLDFPFGDQPSGVLAFLHLDPIYDGTFDQALLSPYAPDDLALRWRVGGCLGATDDPQAQRVVAVLEEVAREVEARDIDSVALAWILQHPSNPDHHHRQRQDRTLAKRVKRDRANPQSSAMV